MKIASTFSVTVTVIGVVSLISVIFINNENKYIASLIISLVISVWIIELQIRIKRFLKYRILLHENSNINRRSLRISFLIYNLNHWGRALAVSVVMVTLTFSFLGFIDGLTVLCLVVLFYVLYPLLTIRRIARGQFGTNASEATELLEYMLTHSPDGTGPPSAQVFPSEEEIIKKSNKIRKGMRTSRGYI